MRGCDAITLATFLSRLPADPTDPDSPKLRVSVGVLGDDDEKVITDEAYGNNPYCYLLGIGDVPVQRYDDGRSRWLNPFDLVLECRDASKKPVMLALIDELDQRLPNAVDELRPGVPLAGRFVCVRFLPPEERRKNLLEATLVLENRL